MRKTFGLAFAPVFGVALSLSLGGPVQAQQVTQTFGVVIGEVDRCNNGADSPVSGVNVSIDGDANTRTETDDTGRFTLQLAPGQYTVIATASDGSKANLQYVPVTAGVALDVGALELGGGVLGCGAALPDTTGSQAPAAPATTAATPSATDTSGASSSPTLVPPTVAPSTSSVPAAALTPGPSDTPSQPSGGYGG